MMGEGRKGIVSLLLCLILISCDGISVSISIRTRDTWNKLFENTIGRQHFTSDSSLQLRLNSYLETIKQSHNESHLYLLKYPHNCLLSTCHELISRLLSDLQITEYHYEIVDSSYGKIRISFSNLSSLQRVFPSQSLDFVPILPEYKISSADITSQQEEEEEEVRICRENSTYFELHFVRTQLSCDWNSSSLLSRYGALQQPHTPSNSTHLIFSQVIQISCSLLTTTTVSTILFYYSHLSFIHWIEIRPIFSLNLKYANSLTQLDTDNEYNIYQYYHTHNLTGHDEIVGVSDTGIDIQSCFFTDSQRLPTYNTIDTLHRKIRFYSTYMDKYDQVGHGTTVSSILGGDCIISPSTLDPSSSLTQKKINQYRSATYNAKIAFMDISGDDEILRIPGDINLGMLEVLYEAGARVINLSWGSSSNKYTIDARNVDIFMWNHPDALVLLAAGNSGTSGYRSVGSPASCKSGLTVGASLNSVGSWESTIHRKRPGYNKNSLAAFSSRGPTYDGRMKPEVCGVGYYVTASSFRYPPSADPLEIHSDLTNVRGISFSTPLLASHAILIREYFRSGYYPSGTQQPSDSCIPSGALMKAILVHSTRPLSRVIYDDGDPSVGKITETTYGDNLQGYGRVVLSDTLHFEKTSQLDPLTLFVIGCSLVHAGDKSSRNITRDMTKTMVSLGEIHRYELKLKDSHEKKQQNFPIKVTLVYTDFYPSLGSSLPLVNDLDISISNETHIFYPYSFSSTSHQHIDRLNPVEVIIISHPSYNSTYQVTVTASKLVTQQPYALVITGNIYHPSTVISDKPSSSNSILSNTPVYVVVSVCVVAGSLVILSIYYIIHKTREIELYTQRECMIERDRTTIGERRTEGERRRKERESNLRSFSEREGYEYPKHVSRHTQSRRTENSILNDCGLEDMYPAPPSLTMLQTPLARPSSAHLVLPPPPTLLYSIPPGPAPVKTCTQQQRSLQYHYQHQLARAKASNKQQPPQQQRQQQPRPSPPSSVSSTSLTMARRRTSLQSQEMRFSQVTTEQQNNIRI